MFYHLRYHFSNWSRTRPEVKANWLGSKPEGPSLGQDDYVGHFTDFEGFTGVVGLALHLLIFDRLMRGLLPDGCLPCCGFWNVFLLIVEHVWFASNLCHQFLKSIPQRSDFGLVVVSSPALVCPLEICFSRLSKQMREWSFFVHCQMGLINHVACERECRDDSLKRRQAREKLQKGDKVKATLCLSHSAGLGAGKVILSFLSQDPFDRL